MTLINIIVCSWILWPDILVLISGQENPRALISSVCLVGVSVCYEVLKKRTQLFFACSSFSSTSTVALMVNRQAKSMNPTRFRGQRRSVARSGLWAIDSGNNERAAAHSLRSGK